MLVEGTRFITNLAAASALDLLTSDGLHDTIAISTLFRRMTWHDKLRRHPPPVPHTGIGTGDSCR
jgi:hypothetical protein